MMSERGRAVALRGEDPEAQAASRASVATSEHKLRSNMVSPPIGGMARTYRPARAAASDLPLGWRGIIFPLGAWEVLMTGNRVSIGIILLVAAGMVSACTSDATKPRFVPPGDSTLTDTTKRQG
jgi:hypothetical protein